MPDHVETGENCSSLLLIIIGGFLLRLAGLVWGEAYHHASSGDEMDAYRVALEFASGQDRAPSTSDSPPSTAATCPARSGRCSGSRV